MNKSLLVGVIGLVLGCAVLFWALDSQANHATSAAGNAGASGSSVAGNGKEAEGSSVAQGGSAKSASTLSQAGGTPPPAFPVSPLPPPVAAVPRPVSTIAGHPVEYPGQFANASVSVDGKSYQLTPNQVGNFPRIQIQPEDQVHVQVAYPQSQAGDPVVVETEDGGNLDGKKTANIVTLDASQNIQFNFQATSQQGIYHIALRNGPDVKVLSFWAGPEPAVRQ